MREPLTDIIEQTSAPDAAGGGRSLARTLGLDAVLVGAPKVLGGVALIGLNVLAARQLAPSAYAVFAVGLTALLLVDSIFGSAFDLGVLKTGPLQSQGADGLTAVERAAILAKLLLAGGVIVVVAAAGRWISVAAFGSDERRALLMTALAGAGVLMLRSVQVHLQLTRRFELYGTADIAHTAGRVLLAGGLLAAGAASPAALLGCYALAPLAVTSVFAGRIWRGRTSVAWFDVEAWTDLGRFVRLAIVTCGLGSLVSRLDILFLTAAGRPTEVGIFGVASTLALVPSLLGAYLAPIFAPRIAPLCREGRFRPFYLQTQIALWAAGAAMLLAGFLGTRFLIETLLPARYAASIDVVLVLLPAGIAGLLIFPLTLHFLMFYAPTAFLALDALSLPVLIPAYIWAARTHGAIGVAWVTAIATLSKAVIAQAVALRLSATVDGNVEAVAARPAAAPWFAGFAAAIKESTHD